MDNSILPVEAIRERDVDLILLEELCSDILFCEWFVKELNLPILTSVNGAWRSISDFGLGETDILFSYNSNNSKIYVLIENKLDTSFQNEQFNRYLSRAEAYLANEKCDEAFTILVAPQLYCENQIDFDVFITYESISEKFESLGTPRNLFKSKLLQIAIEKLRRGYQPVNSIPVQSFWHSYWKYKHENYPKLRMKKPDIVPHNSDWPMLFDDRFKDVIFYHKLAHGNTDLTFKGFSLESELKIKENTPDFAMFIKHGKSFSIRIFSGKIDRTKDFKEQVNLVEIGLQNLEKLRFWWSDNQKMIK